MELLITNFSNRYFRAFDRWGAGKPLTEAWRITFEAAEQGDLNAGQEVLLFSNVHVQHDLPFAYERMGLETPSGASRKPDHDAVNEVNARVFDGIEKFIAAHYDPSFSLIDLPVVPARRDRDAGAGEVVARERLAQRRAPARRATRPRSAATVVETITETSVAWARMISSVRFPGYGAARDEFSAQRPLSTVERCPSAQPSASPRHRTRPGAFADAAGQAGGRPRGPLRPRRRLRRR